MSLQDILSGFSLGGGSGRMGGVGDLQAQLDAINQQRQARMQRPPSGPWGMVGGLAQMLSLGGKRRTLRDQIAERERGYGDFLGSALQSYGEGGGSHPLYESLMQHAGANENLFTQPRFRALAEQIVGSPPPALPDRKILKDAGGRQRYIDDQSYVFPDYQEPEAAPKPTDTAKSIRAEWGTHSKTFRDTQGGYRRVLSSAKQDSAAGDIALIFNFMKTQDPESVVRESEFSLAQNAGSLPQRLQAHLSSVINGERLTPEQRADFVGTAQSIYSAAAGEQERMRGQYQSIAERQGIPVEDALLQYIDMELLGEDPLGTQMTEEGVGIQEPGVMDQLLGVTPAAASEAGTPGMENVPAMTEGALIEYFNTVGVDNFSAAELRLIKQRLSELGVGG